MATHEEDGGVTDESDPGVDKLASTEEREGFAVDTLSGKTCAESNVNDVLQSEVHDPETAEQVGDPRESCGGSITQGHEGQQADSDDCNDAEMGDTSPSPLEETGGVATERIGVEVSGSSERKTDTARPSGSEDQRVED